MTKYAEEYVKYLIYFHTDRDFFECHEVLEEYWKGNPKSGFNKAWIGLIQVAVSTYHHRRNNIKGAHKMLDQALINLSADDLTQLGINSGVFLKMLQERKTHLEKNPKAPYSEMDIPIADPELLKQCNDLCAKQGLQWGSISNMYDEELIHKHSRRDRSEVINARLKELERRQASKESV
ncbi:MAG TPA: DUF309 domain-containing protein [Bacilli bacterium]